MNKKSIWFGRCLDLKKVVAFVALTRDNTVIYIRIPKSPERIKIPENTVLLALIQKSVAGLSCELMLPQDYTRSYRFLRNWKDKPKDIRASGRVTERGKDWIIEQLWKD